MSLANRSTTCSGPLYVRLTQTTNHLSRVATNRDPRVGRYARSDSRRPKPVRGGSRAGPAKPKLGNPRRATIAQTSEEVLFETLHAGTSADPVTPCDRRVDAHGLFSRPYEPGRQASLVHDRPDASALSTSGSAEATPDGRLARRACATSSRGRSRLDSGNAATTRYDTLQAEALEHTFNGRPQPPETRAHGRSAAHECASDRRTISSPPERMSEPTMLRAAHEQHFREQTGAQAPLCDGHGRRFPHLAVTLVSLHRRPGANERSRAPQLFR